MSIMADSHAGQQQKDAGEIFIKLNASNICDSIGSLFDKQVQAQL